MVKYSRVSFATHLGGTHWLIEAEYIFNGETYTVSTVYNMDSNFMGDVACRNMASNFPAAAAQHFSEFYKSNAFVEAVGQRKNLMSNEELDAKLGKLKKAFQDGLITEDEFKAKRSQIIQEF